MYSLCDSYKMLSLEGPSTREGISSTNIEIKLHAYQESCIDPHLFSNVLYLSFLIVISF